MEQHTEYMGFQQVNVVAGRCRRYRREGRAVVAFGVGREKEAEVVIKKDARRRLESSGGEARIRTGGKGFAGLCLTTWPLRRKRTA